MPGMWSKPWGLQGLSTHWAPLDAPTDGGQGRTSWPVFPGDEGLGLRMVSDLPTEWGAEPAQAPRSHSWLGCLPQLGWPPSLAEAPSTEGTGPPRPSEMRSFPGHEVGCSQAPKAHQSHPAVPALGTQGGKGQGAQWHPLSAWVLRCLWSDCMIASRIQSRSVALPEGSSGLWEGLWLSSVWKGLWPSHPFG